MKNGALNKFTHQREDRRANFKKRRTRIAPKDKDMNEEDDVETLGTINMIEGGPEL